MKKLSIRNKSIATLVLIMAVAFAGLNMDRTNAKDKGDDGDRISGQYIIVFKDKVSDPETEAIDMSVAHKLGRLYTYKNTVKGFAATVSDSEIEKIKNDPRVQYVVEDKVVSMTRKPGDSISTQPVQTVPTGVNRIGIDPVNKGAGVNVAIIDTGIYLTHPDLAANIVGGKNCSTGRTYNDGNGHGTHVAGTVAAIDNGIGVVGVAPQAKLWAVRVLDNYGNGTTSSVICGIDFVTSKAPLNGGPITVANMSLGGSGASDNNCGYTNNDPMHQAICRSRDAGVTYVVAAGNNGTNANTFVPAAYNDAVITVSALVDSDGKAGGLGLSTPYGADDTFASFSNYGSTVDLGAPGVNILSTWKGGGYNTISGTSMAAPHVTGAVALYLSTHSGATWTTVRDALVFLGENTGFGHTDPSGLHPEPIVQTGSL